jgi:Ca-activated chloride channel family protein
MMLQLDYSVLIGLAIVLILLYRFFFFSLKSSALLFPALKNFRFRKHTFLERFSKVPAWLFLTALVSLGIALLDPHIATEESDTDVPPHEGLAFYLVLDRSGSMATVLDQKFSRFTRLQEAATQLINKFPKDLIGVVAFARAAEVIAPLTLDHKLLNKKIDKLEVVKDVSQDGTSMGYAIYKTAHLIAASKAFAEKDQEGDSPYKILSAFMIIISDGLQNPSLLDKGSRLRTIELEEAAAYAKEKGIKIYIVNIEPRITEEKFAPNRREMERITKSTGGELIFAHKLENLQQILLKIPEKEKSQIYAAGSIVKTSRISFFPYFVFFSLVLLGFYMVLSHTVWRKAI